MKRLRSLLPYAPYLLIVGLVMGPLLVPGFVLSMDMVFTPQLRWPQHVDNTYVFYALLHILNVAVPADLIEKMMLVAILLLSGIGAHRLVLHLRPTSDRYWAVAAYAGGVFYVVNPFVCDRFMAGQYGVLLGYAFLPWFARSLLVFVANPRLRAVVRVALWATAISIVSIHSIGLALIVTVATIATRVRDRQQLRRVTKFGVLGVAIVMLLASYWLLPVLAGHGRIASSIATFGGSERQAFATVDVNGLGPFGSLLGLQGFWQEARGLFMLPIDVIPFWGLVQLALWTLVALGIAVSWQRQRCWLAYFAALGCAGAILATGWANEWLVRYVPFFAGYREPQKFAALVALAYVYFIAWAVVWLLQKVASWRRPAVYGVAALCLILPLVYTPTMLWGFYGQLRPAQYPVDWYAANAYLDTHDKGGLVLFLPWHLYMSYSFAGRIIASPAPAFFDKPMIVSDDPELAGVQPQTPDALKQIISRDILPAAARGQAIAPQLWPYGVRYILLAKELDFADYGYLSHQPGVTVVMDTPTLKLYELTRGTIEPHANN